MLGLGEGMHRTKEAAVARSSGRGSILALLLAIVALALAAGAYFAWSARRVESPVKVSLELPKAPLPDGPKLPDPPIPAPR